MVNIIIADDHQLAAEGLSFLLSSSDNIDVIEILTNGIDVAPSIEKHGPDILILDMGLPQRHGLEVLRDIKSKKQKTKVIILTGLDDPGLLKDAFVTGAEGVLTKATDTEEILQAIHAVNKGRTFLGKSVISKLNTHYPNLDLDAEPTVITKREKEILLMIANGRNSAEISISLNIAEATVRTHRQNLMEKLRLHNTAEITSYVLKRGLNS